ncbi:MAG: sulfate ABC transporter permease subunit CysT [Planctomycetota bacterium]|nr:MAG: sulfate ABC transporter permease subunit CysT [Planctomycetota bacterium]
MPARAARAGVIGYITVLVILPLAALVFHGLENGLGAVVRAVTEPVALDALQLTFWTAAVMALLNAVMGTATAWVLVRYRFPGRALLSALVDLPFAIPTLVTGVMLVLLYGPQTPAGGWLSEHGFPVAYAPPGILLALLFISVPFVVRAVEPVLMELDPAEEEAARTLGAGDWVIFRRIVLPALMPAILSGTLQSFARALGEFGSIVIVAGNIPHRTLTAPVHIFGEIESGSSQTAAAVSVVLVAVALLLEPLRRWLGRRLGARRA